MATRFNEDTRGCQVHGNELELALCPPGKAWPTPAAGISDRAGVAEQWLLEVTKYKDLVHLTKLYKNNLKAAQWIAVEKATNNEFGEVAP